MWNGPSVMTIEQGLALLLDSDRMAANATAPAPATATATGHPALRADPSSPSWPDYDPLVWDALVAAHELLGPDYQYLSTMAEVRDAQVDRLSRKDLSTLLTVMVRGERFSTGHLIKFIEDGRLQQALAAALGFLAQPE